MLEWVNLVLQYLIIHRAFLTHPGAETSKCKHDKQLLYYSAKFKQF